MRNFNSNMEKAGLSKVRPLSTYPLLAQGRGIVSNPLKFSENSVKTAAGSAAVFCIAYRASFSQLLGKN